MEWPCGSCGQQHTYGCIYDTKDCPKIKLYNITNLLTDEEKAVLKCLLDIDEDCKLCPFDKVEENVCGLYVSFDGHKTDMLKKLTENGLI